MSRGASNDFNALTAGQTLEPFLAVEMLFDSPNEVRAWSGFGTLTIDGDDYTGAGTIMQVSAIEETSEIAARGANFTLTGIPSELVSLALSEPYQGRVVNVWFGLFDVTAGASEVIKMFSGLMDVMTINDDPNSVTITMSAENRLIQLERPNVSRYTSEDQKRKYPNDLGFDFVNDIQDKEIKWGG